MEPSDPIIQPERLRSRRMALRLTQDQLAERSGVNQSTISQLERGEQTPTVRTLVGLSLALGVTMEWLLGLDEGGVSDEREEQEAELFTLFRQIDPAHRAQLVDILRRIVELYARG